MAKFNIDGVDYDSDQLSEAAKQQLNSLIFVDQELQRLQAQIAVYRTARIAFSRALKEELLGNANASPLAGDTLKFN